jgi:hypothetical protein
MQIIMDLELELPIDEEIIPELTSTIPYVSSLLYNLVPDELPDQLTVDEMSTLLQACLLHWDFIFETGSEEEKNNFLKKLEILTEKVGFLKKNP